MSSIRTTFAGAAAAVGSSVALLLGGMTPVAHADPAPPPLPIDALQAPGLSAVQSIGPAIQQAAADPTNAASTLMAAAAAFAGNSAVPPDSKNVASAVNQFVAHVPAPGAVPGAEAHLPAGVDPAHAVGPVPDAAPVAAPAAVAAPGPAPAPVAAPAPIRRPRRPRARTRSGACAGARSRGRPGSCARVRSRRPADAGLHVPVDQQRVPGRRRQCAGDRDLGRGSGEDPGARPRPPARRPTCSPRSARPARQPSRSCR